MQNLLQRFLLILLLSTLFVGFEKIFAQCPGAETCKDAYVFCSLDEMNGLSCSNTSSTPICYTNCNQGGYNHNASWWAFISPPQGGILTISMTVGSCGNCNNCNYTNIFGFEYIVWEDCSCSSIFMCLPVCIAPNTIRTSSSPGALKPCTKYYLSVDGCCNCVCDFTINTSGGGIKVQPLGNINDIPSGIIEPVCVGECNYPFHVDQLTNGCWGADYQWTLDGVNVGGNSNDIKLDFQKAGDFVICVTASIGNSNSGTLCSSQKQCATVKVRQLPDEIGLPRTICHEIIKAGGLKWHTQNILKSGTYREHLTRTNCCKFDSVVDFIALNEPPVKDVYFITCSNEPYFDDLGHKYLPCQDHLLVKLPNYTDPFLCDSTYRLTAVSLNVISNWSAKCLGAQVELSANINILDTCSVKTIHKLNYKWYKKADTTKIALSNTEQLIVDTASTDYCLDIGVKVFLGSDSAICIKTLCENIDESKNGTISMHNTLDFCDSAFVDGNTYTQSTTLTRKLKSVFGCDSVINTEINVNKSSQTAINLIGCDSIIVNGQIYTQSVILNQILKTTNGCDSIVFTNINITKSSSSNLSLKSCDSIVVNGKVYYQSGIYSQTLLSSENCDSILNMNLTIGKTNTVDLKMSACDSIVINRKVYFQSGLYSERLQNISSCDSLVNLDLTIFKTQRDSLSFSDCDKVVYKGKIYTQTVDYPEFYKSVNGCDSIVNVHINITNSNTSPLILIQCDSVTINGIYYDQSGNFTQKLKSANGCDSTLNIDLSIGHKTFLTYKYTHCDSAIINGKWYYLSGNYTQTIKNSNQCDSSIDIDLSITKSTIGDTIFRSCDSVMINGITYRQTGIYQQKLANSVQCDSILIIDFTRLSKSSTNVMYRSCDSIAINGRVYLQSGIYTQKLSNLNQCDSLINLDIVITNSNSQDSIARACDSLTFNGQTYYQTGDYSQKLTNTDFCDSTLFLNLTINKSSSINYSTKACDAININGQIFNQSGNYTQYLKDSHQCDSTVQIQLTINKNDSSSLTKNACDSIELNGITYYNSGQYKQALKTSYGCDSTLTLELIIKPGNPSKLDAGIDTSICEGDVIKLNGKFSGNANFFWHSTHGVLDNPNNLSTNYYSTVIGDERIYLQAADDCKQWLDSLAVHVLPKQIVQVTGDTILNPCKEISFTASGGANYIWTPSSLIECLDPACSRVRLKSTTNLIFTISTDGPCAVPANLNLSLSKIQTDVYLPNVFSPNGDNINDVFLPVFNCDQVDYYSLQIFDRWGNLVFESLNKDKGWNGKYQDQNMNPGVYPYVLQYQIHGAERKVKAGDITLIR